ncbi:MAG: 3',5'-cyclic adenosine monophosphate phosphodiesterase CpdA [Phycisphaerae bacterium]|nr:3',5'-cyclic adenosine monophosphate phosphodiesterase CpdA [Phycisphaerae bacterium]
MSNPRTRKIWFFADPHIGHESDGRDGGDWLAMDVADLRDNVPDIDYAVCLGDMSHAYKPEQLQGYADIRAGSHIARWFEVCGNHDFRSTRTGDYQRIVRCPRYWTLRDGNVLMIDLPAERGNAAGLFVPEVQAWLRREIAAAPDCIVIVCAHQFPCLTVERTERPERGLYPSADVERFIRDVRIDLWWGGHIHSGPRTANHIARKWGVTFINAASASHSYNTQRCESFVLELADGSDRAEARCRDHDNARFLPEQSTTVELSRPVKLSDAGPVLTPADLDVPERYSRIDDEVVMQF